MNDNKIISEECVRHRRSLPISSLLYTSTALNEKHTQFIYKIFSFQFFREIKSIYERSQTEGSEGDVEKNAKHHTHTHHIHQNVWKLVVFADTVVALRLRRGKSWSAAWSMRCWYVSDVVMSEEVMMQKRKENEKVKTSAQEEQSGERRDRCHDPKEFKQIQIHKMSEPGRRLKIHFGNCTNNRRTLNVYEKWKKKTNKYIHKIKFRSEEKYIYHLFGRVIYVIRMRLIYIHFALCALRIEYVLENAFVPRPFHRWWCGCGVLTRSPRHTWHPCRYIIKCPAVLPAHK